MRKIIAAINTTLDGVFDHTAVDPDDEIHDHYAQLLDEAEVILYGRKTYQLMQFWQTFLVRPSEEKSLNDFARAIDNVPKIVFSRTLEETGWNTAVLSKQSLQSEIDELKQGHGKNIFIGSRSLIIQLIKANLLDELQLCIHPVLVGKGLQLFETNEENKQLTLVKAKTFAAGAVILYYDFKKD